MSILSFYLRINSGLFLCMFLCHCGYLVNQHIQKEQKWGEQVFSKSTRHGPLEIPQSLENEKSTDVMRSIFHYPETPKCQAANSQSNDKKIISLFTNTPIVIDGQLDQKEWKNSIGIVLNDQSKESTNKALVRTLWDEQNLYISFKVEDQDLQAKQNVQDHPLLYMDDMVEFLLDVNNDKGSCWNSDDIIYHINILGTKKDDRGTIECESDPKWDGRAEFAIRLIGTLNDSTDLDTGYNVEISIPWKELDVKPNPEMIMGANFAIGDNGKLFDWVNASPFRSPDAFGNLVLRNAKE